MSAVRGAPVAEFDRIGRQAGKVHRNPRKVAPRGRNRRQYRVACGRVVRAGFPVDGVILDVDLCRSCWPSPPPPPDQPVRPIDHRDGR